MDLLVFCAVALAALLHAGWNALVKAGGDPLVRLAMTNAVAGLCGLALLPWVPPLPAASWPYLAAGLDFHQSYALCLVLGYRSGDLPPRAAATGLADRVRRPAGRYRSLHSRAAS